MNPPHFLSKICGVRLAYKQGASSKLELYSQVKTFDRAVAKFVKPFFWLVREGGLGITSSDFNRCVLTALAVAILITIVQIDRTVRSG